MVTLNPLDCNNLPSDAEIMPLPRLEVTPPVTKMYLAVDMQWLLRGAKVAEYRE